MNLRYIWGIGGLLWISIVIIIFNLFSLNLHSGQVFVNIFLFVVELILVAFFSFLVDKGYWSQCQEFRADRFAALISKRVVDGVEEDGRSLFETYENNVGVEEVEEKKYSALGWFWPLLRTVKWFCTNGDISVNDYETHPSMEAREIELNRKEKWSFSDYIRYATVIRIRAINGKSKKVV